MLEFLKSICPDNGDFILAGIIISKTRRLYVPRLSNYVKAKKTENTEFRKLEDRLMKHSPKNAKRIINGMLMSYGGKWVYIPAPGSFIRHARNEQMQILRGKGCTCKELSLAYGVKETALRNILKNQHKA